MSGQLGYRYRWIFCVAALGVWLAHGSPVHRSIAESTPIRPEPVPPLWLIPFMLPGVAVLAAMVPKLRAA